MNFEEIHPAHLRAILERKVAASSLPKSFLTRIKTLSERSKGHDLHATKHLVNSRGLEEAIVKVRSKLE